MSRLIALRELTEELRRVHENAKMHLNNGESLQMFRCQEDDYNGVRTCTMGNVAQGSKLVATRPL